MRNPPLVACLIRHRGKIFLTDRDGTLGPVSETAAIDPASDEARSVARRLVEDVAREPVLIRRGDSVEAAGRPVVPFLFDCAGAAGPGEWVSPPDIDRRETEPWAWAAYRRVAPTVENVRAEPEYGSALLSVRALEILRDHAATGASWEGLVNLAEELIDAQPGMAVLENRVNRVMSRADSDAETVERSARAEIPAAVDADSGAAENATGLVDGADVFTVSRSGTVLSALEGSDPESVTVTQSLTDGEGVSAAEHLVEHAPTTLIPDAASAHAIHERDVDCVLVGADAVLPDGGVVNKVGTRGVALAAAHEGVPVYVVAASDKVHPDGDHRQQHRPTAAVYDGDEAVDVHNPVFDVTPPSLVDRVVTERGRLSSDEVELIADELAGATDWRGTS